jgi:hypothetical protein
MLSRRWLINYLLLTLIIVLTWVGNKYPIGEDQKINRHAITQLRPQDIKRIKIETADSIMRLQKQGGRWLITDPVSWYANNITAERLSTLATLEASSSLPRDEIKLSTLGLTIPKAVVTLNDTSIYFGNTNQIGNRRYLLVEENVFLSDDIHFPFISQGLTALLDRRLLPASLSLQSIQSTAFVVHKKGAKWVSENAGHETESIQALVSNWQSLQASGIKLYDRDITPLHKVTAITEDDTAIEFFVLSIKPEIVIARPDLDVQYHFPDHQYYKLLAVDTIHD